MSEERPTTSEIAPNRDDNNPYYSSYLDKYLEEERNENNNNNNNNNTIDTTIDDSRSDPFKTETENKKSEENNKKYNNNNNKNHVSVNIKKQKDTGNKQIDIIIPESEHQYTSDAPDQHFYLGGAIIIGVASLFTFLFTMITSYSKINDWLVPLVSVLGGLIIFLIGFLYYLITSKHYFFFGRVWDGIAGGFPFLFLGGFVLFIYFTIGRACYFSLVEGTVKDLFLYPVICICFGIAWIPVFIFSLSFQEAAAEKWRIKNKNNFKINNNNNNNKPRYVTSGWKYIGLMLRRITVGIVISTSLASYMILPIYCILYILYGLYELYIDPGW
eukprot:Tbor_TRINITY_DN6122_c5_g2::TRINITY_DN6122_c5_g2_i12::g.22804::m.22804